uniref:Uncharacterized protein n=1 Tax=Setaria italica TaxID=4555 RepID=K3Y232_SETIT
MVSGISAVPVILLVIMMLSVVPEAVWPLGGDVWAPARETELRAGPSCGTNSSNSGCPHLP